MMSALGLKFEKIDVCPDNCMLFWKEHANEKKCLECGQSRFIEVVTDDGEKVMTEVTKVTSLLSYHTSLKAVVYL
jgi:ferredoxin-like protein FixX